MVRAHACVLRYFRVPEGLALLLQLLLLVLLPLLLRLLLFVFFMPSLSRLLKAMHHIGRGTGLGMFGVIDASASVAR